MQDTFSLLSMAMRKQALSLCVLLGRARWSPLCPFSGGDWRSVGLLDGLPASPKNPAVFVPAAAACYPLDVQQWRVWKVPVSWSPRLEDQWCSAKKCRAGVFILSVSGCWWADLWAWRADRKSFLVWNAWHLPGTAKWPWMGVLSSAASHRTATALFVSPDQEDFDNVYSS